MLIVVEVVVVGVVQVCVSKVKSNKKNILIIYNEI